MFRRIESCAGEVEARSNYFYSTWGERDEEPPKGTAKRVVDPRFGPEPHRPGCRVRLLLRTCGAGVRSLGYEAVMVNCNPETVSTDYDTSNRLYFEPLDAPSVLAIRDGNNPRAS